MTGENIWVVGERIQRDTLEAIHLETDVESKIDTYKYTEWGTHVYTRTKRLSNAFKFIVKSVTLFDTPLSKLIPR